MNVERNLYLQALALAKLCFEDPFVPDREILLANAHLELSYIYYDMVNS